MDRAELSVLVEDLRRELARIAGAAEVITAKLDELTRVQRSTARALESISSEIVAHFDVVEGVSR